ncbi:hypothetical protein MLD38_016336 [Melastoma candidum]|uniref:Uncharacterized protein n=1 Tax=Melastoma candidum TaxID=119954 RepID=A0ACB9RMT3_9MYRT|nr:hypothetical protein MLD38_016336 [Melastoma candidum]
MDRSGHVLVEELAEIIERMSMGKLSVIPIFYRASPAEVRMHEKQNGDKGRCYQVAMMAKHGKFSIIRRVSLRLYFYFVEGYLRSFEFFLDFIFLFLAVHSAAL